MSEFALPRARSRRRRRRPFGPDEWFALMFVAMGTVGSVVALGLLLTRDFGVVKMMVPEALLIAEGSFFISLGWPVLASWIAGEDE
jgi:hypothetical protein